jgi:hypothetical protein
VASMLIGDTPSLRFENRYRLPKRKTAAILLTLPPCGIG